MCAVKNFIINLSRSVCLFPCSVTRIWGLPLLPLDVHKCFSIVGSCALPAMLFKLMLVLHFSVFLMSSGKHCILHQLYKFYKLCRYLLYHSFFRADPFINNVDRLLRNSSIRALIYTVHLPEIVFSFSGDSTVVSAQEVSWIYRNFRPSNKFLSTLSI